MRILYRFQSNRVYIIRLDEHPSSIENIYGMAMLEHLDRFEFKLKR